MDGVESTPSAREGQRIALTHPTTSQMDQKTPVLLRTKSQICSFPLLFTNTAMLAKPKNLEGCLGHTSPGPLVLMAQ